MLVFSCAAIAHAQNAEAKAPPVIDAHVHVMDGNFPGVQPMGPNTPQLLVSDLEEKEERFGWAKTACTPALYPSAPGKNMRDVLAEMERLNVTAVVMGEPKTVQNWKEAAPNRVIEDSGIDNQAAADRRATLEELRKLFTTGGFKVMGEIGLRYQGLSPSDMSMDKYFALAQELDVPVAIHMGTGGSRRANITSPNFRGSKGDLLLL